MKLIVGLGNIGPHYDGTRHNVGFHAVEVMAASHNLEWVTKDRFKASVAEGDLFGHKVICLRPNTYYNSSGEAVRAVKDFYKLQGSDILVIHDELDLPFGTIRARMGGTDAGNNGIKSVNAHIGEDYARIRVGIAPEGGKAAADHIDYVLSRFSHEENQHMGKVLAAIADITARFASDNQKFEHTSVRINEPA